MIALLVREAVKGDASTSISTPAGTNAIVGRICSATLGAVWSAIAVHTSSL
jgi:hypothetical protein